MKKLWGIVFSLLLALFCVLISEDKIKASTETKVIEVIWNDETVGSYSTFSGALEMYNSLDGATMKLIADYDFTSEGREFVFESSGNLDLNGYRLSHVGYEPVIQIERNVSLSLVDNSGSNRVFNYKHYGSNNGIGLNEGNDFYVVGGVFDCGTPVDDGGYPRFFVYGHMEIDKANIVGMQIDVFGTIEESEVEETSNGTLILRNGTIAGGAGIDGTAVFLYGSSLFNMYGGSIKYQNWKAINVFNGNPDIYGNANIEINMYGGTISECSTVFALDGNSELMIYNGIIENNDTVVFNLTLSDINISGGIVRDNNLGVITAGNVYLSGNPVFENNKFDMNGMILDADIGLIQDSSMGIDAKIVITGELGEDTKINFGIVDSNLNVGVGEGVVGYNNYNTDDFKDHFGSAIPGLELASDGVNTYIVSDIKAINYELNGGEFVQQCNALTEYPVGYGAKLPVNACVARTGYTFLGWTLSNEVEDTTYVSSIQESATEDVVVYARWKIKEYTINFYDENRTSIIKTIKVNHGSSIVPTPLEDKTPNEQYSYPFDKWVRDNNTEAVFNNIVEDMNVYATFTRKLNKYTVTWKNGDEVLRIDIVEYGTIPNYEEIPVKEKSEDYTYKFIGWNKEIVAVTGNIEYSARFKPVEIEKESEIPTTAIVAGTEVVAASGLGILTVLKKRKKLL